MKYENAFLVLLIFLCGSGLSVYTQTNYKVDQVLNRTQLNEIEAAVRLYWKWDKTEEPIQAVELLEKISQKDSENWVAPYWAAYISTQLINSDREKHGLYLDKAQVFFNKANKAFAKNPDKTVEPYFHALQSLIYRFRMFKYAALKDKQNYETFRDKSHRELNKGIKLNPNLPVLMVLAATEIGSNTNGDFGKVIASIALLEKAQVEFKKIEERSPADITYWNEHWIKFWLGRLKPPQNKSS